MIREPADTGFRDSAAARPRSRARDTRSAKRARDPTFLSLDCNDEDSARAYALPHGV